MSASNQELIERFFQAYSQRDLEAIRKVMDEKVRWTFPGRNPLSGVKSGVEEVVAFFDRMGMIMGASKVSNETLVAGASDNYILECQHISTRREDGVNIDQRMCVLWRFEDGKIVAGRHFAADERALDGFFNRVSV